MIPQFPVFKNLELKDRDQIRGVTKQFAPYSDYNFLNLWSWNISENVKISNLNDNLVIRFTDYVSQSPFFSFLGLKKNIETARKIAQFSESEGLSPRIKLVAEDIARELRKSKEFGVEEDQNSFDYILSTEILKNYPGSKLANKRNYVKRFKKLKINIDVVELNLSDEKTKQEINALFDSWASLHNDFNTSYEKVALNRFLDYAPLFNTLTVGVFIDGNLEAFWSHEFLNQSCTISHFEKAHASKFAGLYPFLMQETARILSTKEMFFINFEQDLGIKNLREGKEGYLPYGFLKKFTINLK